MYLPIDIHRLLRNVIRTYANRILPFLPVYTETHPLYTQTNPSSFHRHLRTRITASLRSCYLFVRPTQKYHVSRIIGGRGGTGDQSRSPGRHPGNHFVVPGLRVSDTWPGLPTNKRIRRHTSRGSSQDFSVRIRTPSLFVHISSLLNHYPTRFPFSQKTDSWAVSPPELFGLSESRLER